MIRHLAMQNNISSENYNIIATNGVDNIKEFIKKCKNYDNYAYVKSLLFIRDADQNAKGAVNSLQNQISAAWNINLDNFGNYKSDDNGLKIGFFIMPGLNEKGEFRNGTLEDLCLEILHIQEENINYSGIISQVDLYIKNIEEVRGKNFKTSHKNRLHLCFSSTDKFVGSKIGGAAKKGAFDFNSNKLIRLKDMILQMN